MKINEASYIVIQRWMVSQLDLSGIELNIYAMIYGYSQEGKGEFFGGYNYISEWLNCSKGTTINALKNLESKGYIKKRQEGENGNIKNFYTANSIEEINWAIDNENNTLSKIEPVPYQKLMGGDTNFDRGNTNIYISNNIKKTNNKSNNKSAKQEQDEKFNEFWQDYPKKKDKQAAHKAFMKIKPDNELFQKIMESLKKQKQTNDWTKENGQYIPFPATWLNGMRWEDEIDIKVSEPPKDPYELDIENMTCLNNIKIKPDKMLTLEEMDAFEF